MSPDAALAKVAEATYGVFTLRQALDVGLTRNQAERRLEAGRWVEVYRSVYRIRGVPGSWRVDLMAACLAGGSGSAASRRSAAAVHSLPGARRDVVEITCRRWRRAQHSGLVVHESKALDPIDVTVVDGIPVTSVARTLFDLGGVYQRGMVELALDRALQRGLVTVDELDRTVRRLSRQGRPGGPTLRQLLEARGADRPTESVMETRLLQALRARGLPRPVPQFEVWSAGAFVARVDFAYPDARIAIEYDSDEFHAGRAATTRDRARRHALVAAGWLPIDVGPADVRRGAVAAAAAISDALHRRSGVNRPV